MQRAQFLTFFGSNRHNTYLQECTGQREPTYQLNIHDTKLLFLRFAMEQSFSVDTGGGGRESNIHLIPYIIHTVLYVLNTYAFSFTWSQPNTHFAQNHTDFNLLCDFQNKGHITGGEKPSELLGAAVREVGGDFIRSGRAALFHHIGHAHPSSRALEDHTCRHPAQAAGHRSCPQSLTRGR